MSAEEKKSAPPPEKDDDVSGMDGNWVFEVDEGRMGASRESVHYDPVEGDEEAAVPPRMYTEDEVQEVVRRVVMAMQMSENPDVLFQARCILTSVS